MYSVFFKFPILTVSTVLIVGLLTDLRVTGAVDLLLTFSRSDVKRYKNWVK